MNYDTRALSVAVTHALTVAISTILVSGLIISAGALLESQEQSVGENQLEEIGSDAVTYINTFDRLNGTGENVNVSVSPDYPERIVGSYQYELVLEKDGGPQDIDVIVRVDGLDRSATFPLELQNTRIDTPPDEDSISVSGANVQVNLCANGNITFRGCS